MSKNEEILKKLQKKALSLPRLPGVYVMKNAANKVIYVGKAKSLKNRVSSYFAERGHTDEKTAQMVKNVQDFSYTICNTEFEALLLECTLIKLHSPKFNVLLKDDKGYKFIFVSNDDWRRITIENAPRKNGENLGPYYSYTHLNSMLNAAKKIYKLPLCSKAFSDDMSKVRPCLNHFISLCSAPCAGKISKEEYNEAVAGVVQFLKKGTDETLKELRREMEDCAANLQFEKAAKIRDKIKGIEKFSGGQKVVTSKNREQDVIAIVAGDKKVCAAVLKFRGGKLCDSEHFLFNDVLEGMGISEFIVQYYEMRSELPKTVVVDVDIENKAEIEQFLSEKKGSGVKILRAVKGEQKQLVDMCRLNAAERIAKSQGLSIKETRALDELKGLLGLDSVPKIIEAYDISGSGGADNVAGMVVFRDARPYKSGYRRFAIKTVQGQDDYASMNEVLSRRFAEYDDKAGEEGFGTLPDLILIDGGKGQLSAVLPIVSRYNLADRTFGMVKDDKHKTRALVGVNGEIAIKPTRGVFTLISSIQEEVHRFAIGYFRKKSGNRMLALQLTEIEGVGAKRAAALLKHFGDINKIAAASPEELRECEGISALQAEKIHNFYR